MVLLLIVAFWIVNTSRNYGTLGNRLFWAIVIVSGIVGMKGSGSLAFWISPGHMFPLILALSPTIAILVFLVSYRFVALNIIAAVEARKGIELDRPNIMLGAIFSAVIPLIMMVLGLYALMFGH